MKNASQTLLRVASDYYQPQSEMKKSWIHFTRNCPKFPVRKHCGLLFLLNECGVLHAPIIILNNQTDISPPFSVLLLGLHESFWLSKWYLRKWLPPTCFLQIVKEGKGPITAGRRSDRAKCPDAPQCGPNVVQVFLKARHIILYDMNYWRCENNVKAHSCCDGKYPTENSYGVAEQGWAYWIPKAELEEESAETLIEANWASKNNGEYVWAKSMIILKVRKGVS